MENTAIENAAKLKYASAQKGIEASSNIIILLIRQLFNEHSCKTFLYGIRGFFDEVYSF